MVSGRRCGSVTFWAWTTSVAVHLIALTVFGVVKFSQSKVQGEQRAIPTAKVSRIKKLMQATPIIPKPKVKKPVNGRFAGRTNRLFSANQIFASAKPCLQNPGNFVKLASSTGRFSASSANLPHRIEFFGSFTDERKVCYLVDCSGSMQGIFGRVRRELAESIRGLQPDQYFSIIFFGDGKLFEFGDGRAVRATKDAKSAAYDFIDLVQPAGQTNAMAALKRAVQISDSRAESPSIVYFLTDGFELTTEDTRWFSQEVAEMLMRFAPATKINTIGFWPQSDDREMLKIIAGQSGGEFVFITDD
jgi:hypothetical protein